MSARPYIPDSEHNVFLHSYDNEIPLACNVIYYVESPENEPLNTAMRQLEEQDKPLFENTKAQPYPFRFQYIAQSELNKDFILSALIPEYGEALAAETANDLCRCLLNEQGGTLVARCLPTFSHDGFFVDDHTVCTFPGFRLIPPENAAEKAAWFAHKAAELNFYRLTGESYQKYIAPPTRKSQSGHDGFGMGFIVREKTKQEITDDMLQHSEALSDWIGQNIQDDDEAISVLDMVLKQIRNKGKLKEACKIKVKDKNIYLMLPKNEMKDLSFRRGGIAKMLYVFYLIQIKRAEKDPKVPTSVAQVNLVDYKDELFEVYMDISGKWEPQSVESVWNKESNDFANALSSIRRSFDDIFDVKSIHPKCYSIEIMGNDKMGRSLYGIQLDPDDIELGWPFKKFV